MRKIMKTKIFTTNLVMLQRQGSGWFEDSSHRNDCFLTLRTVDPHDNSSICHSWSRDLFSIKQSGQNSWEKGQVGTNMVLWEGDNDSGCIFVMHNVGHRAGILVMIKVVHRAASLLCTMWSLLALALLCLPASDFNMYYGIQVWKLGIPIFNFQVYP